MKKSTVLGPDKSFVLRNGYAIEVTIDKDTTGTELDNGRKMLRAGNPIGTIGADMLADKTAKGSFINDGTNGGQVRGILIHDIDLTDGVDVKATMLVEGLVNDGNLPVTYDAAVIAALSPKITFVTR